jgi:DNA-binding MarR family transcriptional regulator
MLARDVDDLPRDIVDVGTAMWRRECPEIDCSGKEVTGRILRLSEMFLNDMNKNMAKFQVPFSVYAVVATLRASGPPYRLSPSELQNTLLISSGGVSNIIKKAEKSGYVQRLTDPMDGRGVIVELTGSGIVLSRATMPAQADLERALVACLSQHEQGLLASLLRRLILANR